MNSVHKREPNDPPYQPVWEDDQYYACDAGEYNEEYDDEYNEEYDDEYDDEYSDEDDDDVYRDVDDEIEAEIEFEELENDDAYTTDEEYKTAKERVKGAKKKLFDLVHQLSKEAESNKARDDKEGHVKGDKEGPIASEQGGYVSEYELSADEIHTPDESEEEGDLGQIRRKISRGLVVPEDTDFSLFRWKAGQRFLNRGAFQKVVASYAIIQGRNLMFDRSKKTEDKGSAFVVFLGVHLGCNHPGIQGGLPLL